MSGRLVDAGVHMLPMTNQCDCTVLFSFQNLGIFKKRRHEYILQLVKMQIRFLLLIDGIRLGSYIRGPVGEEKLALNGPPDGPVVRYSKIQNRLSRAP